MLSETTLKKNMFAMQLEPGVNLTGVGVVGAASLELGWATGSFFREYAIPGWANENYGDAELWAIEKLGYSP